MRPETLTQLINYITEIVLFVIPMLVSLALLFFLWGLAVFILNANNEKEREAGKVRMVWGIVALFVVLSIGGLVSIIERTFISGSGGSYYGGSTYPTGGVRGAPATGGGNPPLEGTITGDRSWCVGRGWLNIGNGCQ